MHAINSCKVCQTAISSWQWSQSVTQVSSVLDLHMHAIYTNNDIQTITSCYTDAWYQQQSITVHQYCCSRHNEWHCSCWQKLHEHSAHLWTKADKQAAVSVVRCSVFIQKSQLKGTLHSKLTLGFFSWPKSLYYCDLSLTNCTFVKLELRVQGTRFYGDAGEFDGRRGINLGIWCQWLHGHELDGGVV